MSEDSAREQMVRNQLAARDVHDPRVLEAMRRVPRHRFVPESARDQAYEDRPHPIGAHQTISQPLMVGLMTELLDVGVGDEVLEIGSGSGYQAAVLAELGARVVSVERHAPLAERARGLLEHLGIDSVEIYVGDGTEGWPAEAPYDRIIVTAGAPNVPQPLLDQLAAPGRMVIPVGPAELQSLMLIEKLSDGCVTSTSHGDCVFVPLIGKYGWPE